MHEAISPSRARWILLAVVLSAGIVFLDSTIVNVALLRIGMELPSTFLGTLEGQAYITSGYLAVLSAFLIISGALADRYGRRRVFVIGLVGFGASSVLCGLAPTLELLVLSRLLQGAAGALLVPGALAIITAAFDGAARARAFGIWAAGTSALTLLGPLVGGLVVDVLSWRVAFLVNVPLVCVAVYAAIRHVPESFDEDAPKHLDWLGSIVVALAVGGISFGLIRGQESGWSEPVVFAALVVGVAAAVAFPVLMMTRRDPLVPPVLFRRRAFVVINISTFLIYGALYCSSFLQSLFYQGVLGYTALAAAAVSLPPAIFLTLGSTRVGSLAGRVGVRAFLVVGPVLMALGLAWLARIPATSDAWRLSPGSGGLLPPMGVLVDVLPAAVLFGVGIMLVVAPLTTALMASVPVRNAGVGSAINNAVSRVGQPLLLALLFIAITSTFYTGLADREPSLDTVSTPARSELQPMKPPPADLGSGQAAAVDASSADAFHLAMLACALLLIAGAAVNGVGLRASREPGPVERAEATAAPEDVAALG